MEDGTEDALNACHAVVAYLDSSAMPLADAEEESDFPRIRLHAIDEELAYLDSLKMQYRKAGGNIARLNNLSRQLEREPSLQLTRKAFTRRAASLTALSVAHMALLIGLGRPGHGPRWVALVWMRWLGPRLPLRCTSTVPAAFEA
jgi:hypothetical protein